MGLLNRKEKKVTDQEIEDAKAVNRAVSVDSQAAANLQAKKDAEADLNAHSQAFDQARQETGEDIFADDPEAWETASKMIWKPRIGDVLTGQYDGCETFTEGDFDSVVNAHFIKTKSGDRYSFVGGQVFDKALADSLIKEGTQVRIKFMGQAKAKVGRVNLFDLKYKK